MMTRCSAGIVLMLVGPILLTAAGCTRSAGPKLYPVTGTVEFDGQPVEDGDIIFTAPDGGHSAGGKIVAGNYKLETTPGKKKVDIRSMRDVPGEFREDNPGEKVQVREQFIPAQYNTESTLEADVVAGKEVNFDLKP